MSGIVGLLNFDAEPVDRSLLERMTAFLSYCGPDRQGTWVDGRMGLGHALLATAPESVDERQPCSLDGEVWIVADARVDGRAELIRSLQAAGRDPTSDAPDAALVLHAYHAWGEACLDRLIGDFAFAVWDGRQRRLFCARDHFGVVPFYYAEARNGLVLSNALDCVRAHPEVSDELNEQAIGDFLLISMNMDVATTTFTDVRSLPPAHAMTWQPGGALRIRRYWDLPEERGYVSYKHPQEYVERFRAIFDQAIDDRLRLRSAGTHLSGGMDSSSITVTAHKVLMARDENFDLRAYTVVFKDLVDEEEAFYADQVAAAIGIPSEHLVAEEYLTRAPRPIPERTFPEPPTMIPSQSPPYETARRTAEFSRLILNGTGGDPLFHGRGSWSGYMRGPWRDLPRFLWQSAVVHRTVPRFGIRTALRQRLRRQGSRGVPDWVDPEFARRLDLSARWEHLIAEQRTEKGLRGMLWPTWVSIFASAHPTALGLPLRALFPFFDLRVVLFVLDAPPSPWRHEKLLLREAMTGRLPEAVRNRPKRPLYVPRGATDTKHPWHRLASRPETKSWQRELAYTPELARFIDLQRTLSFIESPPALSFGRTQEPFLPLAQWLRHQRHGVRLPDRSAPTVPAT